VIEGLVVDDAAGRAELASMGIAQGELDGGVYQIGEVHARSRIVLGTDS